MQRADESIRFLRKRVIYEVAKLAYEGRLDEAEYLPEQIIQGTKPHWRCCVYKEREIIRGRVRISLGKAPGLVDDGNIFQVIEAACADCPISSYSVTDNCRSCVGKPCLKACKFGAIEAGKHRSHIDYTKCKECGQCAKECPFHAIVHLERPCKLSCPVDAISYNKEGISVIDEKKCIRCGKCMISCPFAAIGSKDEVVPVIKAIKDGKHVYAMAAPATEGQLGPDINMASWKVAMKELGFTDFVEVGLGADLTTAAEAEEWCEAYENGERRTTSCCPAFVNMIEKHFPELSDQMSTAVSPMCQVSRMIKAKDPEAVTVFIGPCIAKKSEAHEHNIEGNADYVLIYDEIFAMLEAKGIELKPQPEAYQESSVFGKKYANAGGVADSCLEYLRETGRGEVADQLNVARVSGGKELKKTLLFMKSGKLEGTFLEGMVCEGGCFNGPDSVSLDPARIRDRNKILSEAEDRKIADNLRNYDLTSFSGYRE